MTKLIRSITCIYNSSVKVKGDFSFPHQEFKCPLISSRIEASHKLRIVVNDLQYLKNEVTVLVASLPNMTVEVSYNLLLSNWNY